MRKNGCKMVVNAGKVPKLAQRWHNVVSQPYTTPPPLWISFRTLVLQCWYNVGTTLYHKHSFSVHLEIGCKMVCNAGKDPKYHFMCV